MSGSESPNMNGHDTEMPDADGLADHEITNGENTPAPPPHKTSPPPRAPPVDAEACKAVGNKYFKAKDYPRAIEEYSKGTVLALHSHCIIRFLADAAA